MEENNGAVIRKLKGLSLEILYMVRLVDIAARLNPRPALGNGDLRYLDLNSSPWGYYSSTKASIPDTVKCERELFAKRGPVMSPDSRETKPAEFEYW